MLPWGIGTYNSGEQKQIIGLGVQTEDNGICELVEIKKL